MEFNAHILLVQPLTMDSAKFMDGENNTPTCNTVMKKHL